MADEEVVHWLDTVGKLMTRIASGEICKMPRTALAVLETMSLIHEVNSNKQALCSMLDMLPVLWTIAIQYPDVKWESGFLDVFDLAIEAAKNNGGQTYVRAVMNVSEMAQLLKLSRIDDYSLLREILVKTSYTPDFSPSIQEIQDFIDGLQDGDVAFEIDQITNFID